MSTENALEELENVTTQGSAEDVNNSESEEDGADDIRI